MKPHIFTNLAAMALLAASASVYASDAPPSIALTQSSAQHNPVEGIQSVNINPGTAKSSQPVMVTVNGNGSCKFHVDLGDGRSMDQQGALPFGFPVSYIVATYQTSVYTVKVKADAGCQGAAQASVTIGEPVPANPPAGKPSVSKLQSAAGGIIKVCPQGMPNC